MQNIFVGYASVNTGLKFHRILCHMLKHGVLTPGENTLIAI